MLILGGEVFDMCNIHLSLDDHLKYNTESINFIDQFNKKN